MKFDTLSKSAAKLIATFFSSYDLKEVVFESNKHLSETLSTYFSKNFNVQLENLKIEAQRIENGYSGTLTSNSLKNPISFEIISSDSIGEC